LHLLFQDNPVENYKPANKICNADSQPVGCFTLHFKVLKFIYVSAIHSASLPTKKQSTFSRQSTLQAGQDRKNLTFSGKRGRGQAKLLALRSVEQRKQIWCRAEGGGGGVGPEEAQAEAASGQCGAGTTAAGGA
jgi:hypothetical protein